MKAVISGSFRKHLKEIIELKQKLEKDGIQVSKPNNIDKIENKENLEFVKFKGEEQISEEKLQEQYLREIEQCDAHIIYDKDGYIGQSALREMFYGAGQNELSKEIGQIKKQPQVYLLEKPSKKRLEQAIKTKDSDTLRIYYMTLALIEKGNVKVGIQQMYKDYRINETER